MKKILAVVAGAMLVLSACAGDPTSASDDPKEALVDALRSLLEAEALTQAITIDSDTESLVALSEGDLNAETASKILESSITSSATQTEDPADATSATVFDIGGVEALEMRLVEEDLYARVDVVSLLEAFGQDPSQIDALTTKVEGRPGFEWVEPAVAGEWVVVRDALALTQQLGGSTFSGREQDKLVADLLASIENNATVSHESEDDNGAHVRASLPLKATVEDLMKALGPGGGMAGAGLKDSMSDVPEGDVVIDFWIDDDRVSRIAVDVTQFEGMAEASGEKFPEGVNELTIVVDIDEFSGDIEPVPDAIEVDTTALSQALAGLMTGGFGGGAGTPGGSQFDCSTLKGAPPKVIELYAEECPELQK